MKRRSGYKHKAVSPQKQAIRHKKRLTMKNLNLEYPQLK